MNKSTHKIEHKTKKIGLWTAIIVLISTIIGLVTLIVSTFPLSSPVKKEVETETPPIIVDDGETSNEPLTKPTLITYDTVHLLLDVHLSKNPIQVDSSPARIIKRHGIHAFVAVSNKENHTFSIKDGERNCVVTSYVNGRQTISINRTNCK